jgi:hypothetical protein
MTVAGAKRKRIKLHLHEAQEYASRKGLAPMLVSNP